MRLGRAGDEQIVRLQCIFAPLDQIAAIAGNKIIDLVHLMRVHGEILRMTVKAVVRVQRCVIVLKKLGHNKSSKVCAEICADLQCCLRKYAILCAAGF